MTFLHTRVRSQYSQDILHGPNHDFITVKSWLGRWRLKTPASWLFIQPFVEAQIKENIKAPYSWSFLGETTGDQ